MIDASRNRVRVKACYVMMALTLLACLGMVISGKQVIKQCINEMVSLMAVRSFNKCLLWQAVGRHDNLTARNMERKARLREEALKEKEAAALAEKAQWYAFNQTPKSPSFTIQFFQISHATTHGNSSGGGTDVPPQLL